MKVNVFMAFISLIVGGLIFYGFYSASDNVLYSAIASGLTLVMLLFTLAVNSKGATRSSSMVKVVSGIFCLLILMLDILLIYRNTGKSAFIIANGLSLCVWAILAYTVGKTKQ